MKPLDFEQMSQLVTAAMKEDAEVVRRDIQEFADFV